MSRAAGIAKSSGTPIHNLPKPWIVSVHIYSKSYIWYGEYSEYTSMQICRLIPNYSNGSNNKLSGRAVGSTPRSVTCSVFCFARKDRSHPHTITSTI